MAEITHNPHVKKMLGAHSKDGLVERQKIFRDYDGNITRVGKLEGYIPNKRNYQANPVVLGELENQQSFGRNSHDAMEFINAWKTHTPLSTPEKQAFLEDVIARFYKQLKGTPDPIASKDKFGKPIIYSRPDNFVRAVLRAEHPKF